MTKIQLGFITARFESRRETECLKKKLLSKSAMVNNKKSVVCFHVTLRWSWRKVASAQTTFADATKYCTENELFVTDDTCYQLSAGRVGKIV
jgi:hypothetical protein